VLAQSKAASPHREERKSAKQLGNASYRVSAAGIVVGIIITIVYIVLVIMRGGSSKEHY